MLTFRYALRRLGREPGFAAAAIATLAVAIGACTVMFSIVQAVLLRPMGVAMPDRIVVMWPTKNGRVGEFPFAAARSLGERMSSLRGVALVGSGNWHSLLRVQGHEAADVPMAAVSASFFDVVGAPPLLGRTFRASDDQPNAPRVLVLSHALWTRHFGADPTVVGRIVQFGDEPAEIVGVMREEFFYPRGAEFWAPAGRLLADSAKAEEIPLEEIAQRMVSYYAIARLGDAATVDTVRAETGPYLTGVAGERTLGPSSDGLSVIPLPDHIFGSARRGLMVLMGAVVGVLLIACANVAGLLLSRGVTITREMAVRAALGASRWTLVRQLLTESLALAVLGGILGTLAATLLIKPLTSLSPADTPRLDAAVIDLRVLAFTVALTAITTIAVGLLPAWRLSAPSLVGQMRGDQWARNDRGSRADSRRRLVTVQVATALVLCIASALCVRSFVRLAQLDLGFQPDNVLTFSLIDSDDSIPWSRAQGDDRLERMLARLERDPRVTSAGAVNTLPLASGAIGWDTGVLLEGQQADRPGSSSENPNLNFLAVTPHYFDTMGIRLIRGRLFTSRDRLDAPSVAIVSEALANRLWPGQDPIGKRLKTSFLLGPDDKGRPGWQTVVGVVATVRYREIETPRLDFYVPFRQADPIAESFVVRTTGPLEPLVPDLSAALTEIDPNVRLDRVRTMNAIVERVRGPWLFSTTVFSLFAFVALGLSWLGLFGLVAYAVARRTSELGVRMALGAEPRDVIHLMVKQGLVPAIQGIVLGVVGAYWLTSGLESVLFETSTTDLPTFAVAGAGFAAASLVASYLPARRAASVDPVIALRRE